MADAGLDPANFQSNPRILRARSTTVVYGIFFFLLDDREQLNLQKNIYIYVSRILALSSRDTNEYLLLLLKDTPYFHIRAGRKRIPSPADDSKVSRDVGRKENKAG